MMILIGSKMCQLKNTYISSCICKMSKTSKKGKYFWINRRDLEVESVYNNWANIFDKCNPEKQKYRYKLMPNAKSQPCRRFVRNDLVERKIKSCRKASVKFLKFQEK